MRVPNTLKTVDFKDALELAGRGQKHLLLGNGFGVSWSRDFCDYGSLLKAIGRTHPGDRVSKLLRSEFRGRNPESVMASLDRIRRLCRFYGKRGQAVAEEMKRDVRHIPSVLLSALLENHPTDPRCILDCEYDRATTFLGRFDRVFTLNFDLLLCWVERELAQRCSTAALNDGFGGQGRLVWVEKKDEQRLFYLHGAIHLFDEDGETTKLNSQTGPNLVKQVRGKVEQEKRFPTTVCDGTSEQKLATIRNHRYLRNAYENLQRLPESLFIFGWSMHPRLDGHVLDAIQSGDTKRIFVGIHNPSGGREPNRVSSQAKKIAQSKELVFFDAATAHVWR